MPCVPLRHCSKPALPDMAWCIMLSAFRTLRTGNSSSLGLVLVLSSASDTRHNTSCISFRTTIRGRNALRFWLGSRLRPWLSSSSVLPSHSPNRLLVFSLVDLAVTFYEITLLKSDATVRTVFVVVPVMPQGYNHPSATIGTPAQHMRIVFVIFPRFVIEPYPEIGERHLVGHSFTFHTFFVWSPHCTHASYSPRYKSSHASPRYAGPRSSTVLNPIPSI